MQRVPLYARAHGYGAEPGGNGFVGNMEALTENGLDTVFSMNNAKRRKVGPRYKLNERWHVRESCVCHTHTHNSPCTS
jgi:hypothetical protein